MRLNLVLLALVLLAGYGYTVIANAPPRAPVAPTFSFSDLKGTEHSLSDYKGKIVLINFWASWCAPCIKEFPHLIKTAKKYPDDVVLIALSSDSHEDAIKKFIRGKNAEAKNIILALDKNDIAGKKFQTFQLPETYILDRNLQISGKLVGATWKPVELEAMIEKLKQEQH